MSQSHPSEDSKEQQNSADSSSATTTSSSSSSSSSSSTASNGRSLNVSLKGRHVRIKRGGYTHHGIIVTDDGKQVIHYTKAEGVKGLLKGVIQVEPIEKFIGDSPISGLSYAPLESDPPRFPPDEIVERAYHCIGLEDYSLFDANCEHFATYCTHGISYSQQVHEHSSWLTTLGVITGVVSLTTLAFGALLHRASGASNYKRNA